MPVLSLCIPTYNRAAFLEQALSRITGERVFRETAKVEIVLSDNCSTDDTEDICRNFMADFPDKIRYFRNTVNTGMMSNFSNMLQYGKGSFLKLQNDNLIMKPGALEMVVNFVERHAHEKPLLFFSDGNARQEGNVICVDDADELLATISYITTWIGGMGLWKNDLESLRPVFEKYANSLMPNVPVFYQAFLKTRKAVFYNDIIYEHTNKLLLGKGGYNIAEAFAQNYLGILRDYMPLVGYSKKSYKKEKRAVFWHTFYWYHDFNKLHKFERGHYLWYTRDYWFEPYYYLSFLCYGYQKLKRVYRLMAIWLLCKAGKAEKAGCYKDRLHLLIS